MVHLQDESLLAGKIQHLTRDHIVSSKSSADLHFAGCVKTIGQPGAFGQQLQNALSGHDGEMVQWQTARQGIAGQIRQISNLGLAEAGVVGQIQDTDGFGGHSQAGSCH